MSLYPFPARSGGTPPPVPPKLSDVPHIAACIVTAKAPKHKKSTPSVSKAISFDSCFVSLYTSRNNSPTKQLEKPDTSRNNSPTKQLEKLDTSIPRLAGSPAHRHTPSTTSKKDCSSPETPNSPPKVSSLASAKHRAKVVFNARRKGSSSDLETMTTVQEYCMDSPTIPGRPAISHNDPPTLRNHTLPDVLLSSISPPPYLSHSPTDLPCIDRPISPISTPQNAPWPGVKPASNNVSDKICEYYESTYEVPPAVPPKAILQKTSAFLESRRPAPTEKIAILENEKPTEGRAVVKRMERPLFPPVITDCARNHYTPLRPRADSAPPVRTLSARRGDTLQPPARPGSADSMAHPVRKHRQKKSSIPNALPQGVRPSRAPIHFRYSQLESIQSAAKLRSKNFDVLNAKDVEGLSKELRGLEARCQYLRETHRSLRAGRRTMHTRMLTYLRSSRSTVFSRGSLLKQEEALAELDSAIDDWESKLENAEERRAKVKEKLLEHVAAALCVSNGAYSPLERGISTPPATPEVMWRGRESDKESITIYALLADVEQEINRSASLNVYH